MATPLSADRMLAALRAEGVRVTEVRDWRTHNRNHKGPWGPVNGVMIHHTVTSGTTASVQICYDGRSDLPGPLCHGVIAKDGTVYMVGNGRANHAGLGDGDVLRAVTNELPLPPDDEADTDGNAHFYGFECVNLGDGRDPWPEVQVDAIVRASAAICRAHGWGSGGDTSVIGHLEWQPGKVDPRPSPGGADVRMSTIRAAVAERLTHPATWSLQEDTMQLSDPVKLGAWVLGQWPDDTGLADGEISVNTALGSGYAHARLASERSKQILAQLAAQNTVIEHLALALAAHDEQFDADAFVAKVTEKIESATLHFDIPEA